MSIADPHCNIMRKTLLRASGNTIEYRVRKGGETEFYFATVYNFSDLSMANKKNLRSRFLRFVLKKRKDANNVFWIALMSAINRGKCLLTNVPIYAFHRQKSNINQQIYIKNIKQR